MQLRCRHNRRADCGPGHCRTCNRVRFIRGYFVGPMGFSLYTFDKDTLGHSSCSGDCLAKWPALAVAGTPEITVGPGLDLASSPRSRVMTASAGHVQADPALLLRERHGRRSNER